MSMEEKRKVHEYVKNTVFTSEEKKDLWLAVLKGIGDGLKKVF